MERLTFEGNFCDIAQCRELLLQLGRYRMSGLQFARGSAKGGKMMHDCCLICKNLECRKNYVYPYRCLKHKAERFSEQELERMCFSGEKCGDFEERRFECLEEQN